MKTSEYIVNFLEKEGVKHVFTLSGGGIIHLLDSLSRTGIEYICCHHEQAAAIASEAYSRSSNKLGVTFVTSGPGGTNAITGVACSWIDSVPHLIISGQAYTGQTIGESGTRQIGVQEINIVDIVKPITKYAVMIKDPKQIKYHLQKALYLAKSGRPGPVWLDIPANVQLANIDEEELVEFSPAEVKMEYDNPKEKIKKVVELLKKAKRPIFYVGQGVKISGAVDDFLELCNIHKMPFLTARNANDIVNSDHELFIGRPGTWGQRAANFAVQTCDLIICIGCRLSLSQTSYDSKDFARNAKKVVVDIDYNELHKFTIGVDLPVHADAKEFIQELKRQTKSLNLERCYWLRRCREWKEKYPVVLQEYKNHKNRVNAYYFIDSLAKVLCPSDIITTDMGLSFQCTHQAFKIKKGQKLFTNSGLAPMGYGIPAAIGASVANNKQKVILITGDGGMQLNIQELQTIVHNKLPIKIFVLNNGGYMTIRQSQEYGFNENFVAEGPSSGLTCPDSLKIANAYGIKSRRIDSHKNIIENIRKVLGGKGSSLCDVVIDENQVQMPRILHKKKKDGSFEKKTYEDMFPYLDREEFAENIKIED